VRVLSSLRTRLALVVILPAIPAIVALHLITLHARQTLLAQHLESQTGSEDALLGQELIALGTVAVLGLIAAWICSSLLVARGTLLSAAAPIAADDLRSRADSVRDPGGEMQRLFSSVTHDLRSPLTSIKAASTLMLDHERELEGKDRRELLETIREGADSLDRMISNSVQLSRSQSGELQQRRIPASMDEVVARTLERLRYQLRDHHVVLVIPQDLPEVPVDVVQLDQVLANVLENAARFSPAGTEIALSLERRSASLVVRVEDRGPGIPAEQRERIFKPFVKLAAGGGAGLGLPISLAIVEAHGGRMLIEDAPGGGTIVVMELPLDPSMLVVPELVIGWRA
jgi:K+-sensing histidine kinase KdpD